MTILGTGIDIIETKRIEKLFNKRKTLFVNRLFTKREILYCKKKISLINCYSKRFAAKEAFVKSLGIGFRKNVNFKDIEVKTDHYGKPFFKLNKKITQKVKAMFKVKNFNIFLSITDENKYAIASVIISS